jgi:hypothetical protein
MATDPLEKLLRRADVSAGLPSVLPVDLPRRVRHLAERRRRVRIGGAAAAVCVATFLLLYSIPAPRPGGRAGIVQVASQREVQPGEALADAERARAEIARLRAEGDLRMEIVRRTVAIQQRELRLAQLERQAAQPDPLRLAQAQVEEAASILVHHADRLHRTFDLQASAIDSYRRTIDLFPQTRSAQTARARLVELQAKQGDSS